MDDDEVSELAPVPIVLEPLVEPEPIELEPVPEPVPELVLGEVLELLELLGVLVPLPIEPLVEPVPEVPEAEPVPVVLPVPLPLVVDEGLVDDEVPAPLVPELVEPDVLLPVPLPLMLPPWLGATVAPELPWSTGVAPGPDCVVVLVLPPALPPAPVPVLAPEPLVPALLPVPLLPVPPLDWANATPAAAARAMVAATAVFLKLLMSELLFRIDDGSRIARY